MEDTEDSTTDTTRYLDADRRGIVNHYVTLMLQLVHEDPWISVPDIADFLVSVGPLQSAGQIARLFRGGTTFHKTVDRMAAVRTTMLQENINGLRIATRISAGEQVGDAKPRCNNYIGWWSPQVTGRSTIFPIRAIGVDAGRNLKVSARGNIHG